MTIEEALHGISYANILLYSRATPMYDDKDDDSPLFDASKDACNMIDNDDEVGVVRI